MDGDSWGSPWSEVRTTANPGVVQKSPRRCNFRFFTQLDRQRPRDPAATVRGSVPSATVAPTTSGGEPSGSGGLASADLSNTPRGITTQAQRDVIATIASTLSWNDTSRNRFQAPGGRLLTKKTISDKVAGGALKHNPFAGLASRPQCAELPAEPRATFVVKRSSPGKPPPPRKVTLRLESAGRAGKVVTRISGLPIENLQAIASRLRKALGCGATLDGDDVLLLGTLDDRASEWLDRVGDLRSIKVEPVASASHKPSSAVVPTTTSAVGTASGTKRSDIRPGQRVAIVMKADQASGALTEGVVRDLLTSSATHPRGIKVRLESGEVGRVKRVSTP